MRRSSAERYLRLSVYLPSIQVVQVLAEAESTGIARVLWDEAKRRAGVTDIRATVTHDAGTWEVHRPVFSHGTHYYYLDDMHAVGCTECYCRHYTRDVLRHDQLATCRCAHIAAMHRYSQVRDTIEVCRAPGTWFTEDMRIFNALAGGKTR